MSINYDHLTEEERAEARRFLNDVWLWILARPAKTPAPAPAPAAPEPRRKSPRKRPTQAKQTAAEPKAETAQTQPPARK